MSSHGETVCLADDEVAQILQWLAPEDLVRFRTACKSWFSMITSPEFIVQHQRRNAGNGRIIILKESTFSYPPLEATFQFHIFSDNITPGPLPAGKNEGRIPNLPITRRRKRQWQVQGTCNGFFCGIAKSISHTINPSTVYLCNPSIRWAKPVPDYHFKFLPHRTNRRAAYDTYGVGFDSTERDYKILKMRMCDFRDGQAAIFSLKSTTWKRLECRVPHRYICSRSVFVHGSIHWISRCPRVEDEDTASILSFNIHDLVFKKIQLPNSSRNGRDIADSVHVVRGTLGVMMTEMRGTTWVCQVWRMKEYGVVESWEEEFRVEFPFHIRCLEVTAGGKILCRSHPMMATSGRSSVCRPHTLYHLSLYDPKTHLFTNISRITPQNRHFSIDATFDFPDSH